MGEWKDTEFGQIPSEWDLKKVADLKSNDKSAIAMGPFGSNIKAENFVSDGVPIIRGTNFNFDKYISGEFVYLTDEKADELLGSNCKAGDLVFTHRGTIGQVALVPQSKYSRYVISQSGMKLSIDRSKVDNEYLFYFFKSKYGQHQLLKNESQVGVPSISNPLTSLKEIEVPVPKLPEQRAIASILSSLDDKIDLLHRQNQTLEALAETLFRQWFVEEAVNNKQIPLGKLVDVIDNRGKTPPFSIVRTDYPIIEVKSLASSGKFVDYDACEKYVSEETYYNWFRAGHPTIGDILFSTVGSIGEMAFVIENKGAIAQNVIALRPKNISSAFLYQFLSLKQTKNLIMSLDIGAVQPSIKVPHLLDLEVPVPVSTEQIEYYDSELESFFEKMRNNHNQIKTLTQLRDTLLPKLMSGEVRVSH